MSTTPFTAEPAQSLVELQHQDVLGHHGQQQIQAEGQHHDRVPPAQQNTGSMSASENVEITTTQRMISATWGSVFTSLLGMPLPRTNHLSSSLTLSSNTTRCCPCTITITTSSYAHEPLQISCLLHQFQTASTRPRCEFVLSRSILRRKQRSVLPCGKWLCASNLGPCS